MKCKKGKIRCWWSWRLKLPVQKVQTCFYRQFLREAGETGDRPTNAHSITRRTSVFNEFWWVLPCKARRMGLYRHLMEISYNGLQSKLLQRIPILLPSMRLKMRHVARSNQLDTLKLRRLIMLSGFNWVVRRMRCDIEWKASGMCPLRAKALNNTIRVRPV